MSRPPRFRNVLLSFALAGLGAASGWAQSASRIDTSSNPEELTVLGGRVLFLDRGEGEVFGQLRFTHAETLETRILADGVTELVGTLGDRLYFLQREGSDIRLWGTDGTRAGTIPVTPPGVRLNPESGRTIRPKRLGRLFYFTGCTETQGCEPWASDGTPGGTHLIADTRPGTQPGSDVPGGYFLFRGQVYCFYGSAADSLPEPALVGDRMVYLVRSGLRGELWSSDGTAAGTLRLLEIRGDGPRPGIEFLPVIDNRLYFYYDDGVHGDEIWRTDGTVQGLERVTDLPAAAPFGSGPERQVYGLAQQAGRLLFIAGDDNDRRRRLWTTTGVPSSTTPLCVGLDCPRLPEGTWLPLGNRLLFNGYDPTHGREPWVTDGTLAGTRRLHDICPGACSGLPDPAGIDRDRQVLGDVAFFVAAADRSGSRQLWRTDATPQGTRPVQDLVPGPLSAEPAGLAAAGNRLFYTAADGLGVTSLWTLPAEGCLPSPTRLCLNEGRFRVEVAWRDFAGRTGHGQAAPRTGDTGTFWFFEPANVELVVKVLDARSLNQHFWVFYGALSNVEYTLTVTDTLTGAVRRYQNPAGNLTSAGDTLAFGPRSAEPAPPAAAPPPTLISERSDPAAIGPCQPGPRRLCLNGGRFAVEARWKDFQKRTGAGSGVALTGDTGTFWFFDPANVEVVVKILDGRQLNGRFWVFFGALSNVEYTLEVSDTQTGAVKTYTNPSGQFASVADTGAFQLHGPVGQDVDIRIKGGGPERADSEQAQ